MTRVFLLTGIILVVMWLFGFLVFNISSAYIHFFIVIGVLLILFDVFRKHPKN